MKRYTEYGDLTLCYEIESDCDGNHATILEVTDEDGKSKNLDYIHPDTIKDMQEWCESEFWTLMVKHYQATGETLAE